MAIGRAVYRKGRLTAKPRQGGRNEEMNTGLAFLSLGSIKPYACMFHPDTILKKELPLL
jgi:hypothetical protein